MLCRCSQSSILNTIEDNRLISNLSYIFFGLTFIGLAKWKARWMEKRSKAREPSTSNENNIEMGPLTQANGIQPRPDATTHGKDQVDGPETNDPNGNQREANDEDVQSGPLIESTNVRADQVIVPIESGSDVVDRSIGITNGHCPGANKDHSLELTSRETGVMQQFGIFYALGFALACQGIFSTSYHICPSNRTLQFDTTVMHIMFVLALIKLYQVLLITGALPS